MNENKQPLDKHDENADLIMTGQPYARSAGTTIGTDLAREENGSTITRQRDALPADRGMSPELGRVLMGGLIGAALGTLAGALANKRTAEGVNHAVKGVGDGAKTVGKGVNQAAKGLGHAVKSVTEGVNHAVIGGLAEGLNNAVVGAVDAAKLAAEEVKPSVVGVMDAVQDTVEDAKQSVVGAVDSVQGAAEDVKPSENQSFKPYEDRLATGNKQVTTGEFGIGERVETQTADISVPVEKELVVEQIIPVDAGTPVAPVEADFHEGEVTRPETV